MVLSPFFFFKGFEKKNADRKRDVLTRIAGMHSIYLGRAWPIIQQTKVRPFRVKRSDSPLIISCDNKLGLALLQDVVLPGL